MSNSFIGQGLAFPLAIDNRGVMALISNAEKIEQAVELILGTPIGQRVMRPTFGSRLHELMFAPLNAETLGLAELYVEEALTFWEPRIEILEVTARVDPDHPAVLNIEIRYRVKATNDERSLVYPFYQIPGE